MNMRTAFRPRSARACTVWPHYWKHRYRPRKYENTRGAVFLECVGAPCLFYNGGHAGNNSPASLVGLVSLPSSSISHCTILIAASPLHHLWSVTPFRHVMMQFVLRQFIRQLFLHCHDGLCSPCIPWHSIYLWRHLFFLSFTQTSSSSTHVAA